MPAPRVEHLLPAVLLLALVCGGCGGPRYPSATVKGRVTIDGAPVPKGYIYFAMAFAVVVEMLNIRMRKSSAKPAHLHSEYVAEPSETPPGKH